MEDFTVGALAQEFNYIERAEGNTRRDRIIIELDLLVYSVSCSCLM